MSPVLAQIMSASVQGRVARRRRAGTRVGRLGREPTELALAARGPRQAHLDGFDLHANVRVPPNDRARLEHLCRYLLRPPLAQDRLRLRAHGGLAIKLKRAWRDGATHLVFGPCVGSTELGGAGADPQLHGRVEAAVRKLEAGNASVRSEGAEELGKLGPAAAGTVPERLSQARARVSACVNMATASTRREIFH